MSCGWSDPLGCVRTSAARRRRRRVTRSVRSPTISLIRLSTPPPWLWGQLDQATALRIGGAGWGTYLGITVTLAVAIGAGLFLIQVITSALRRDMGGMGRAFRGLLVAFVAGGAAVGVTEILLQAADAISNGIMQVGLGTSDWQSVGDKFATLSATQYGPATLLLAALFTCAATVLVWLALMVRKVLLILTAVFAPVAFAGSLSDITAGWVRKWIEYTLALIASKIVLVIVFVVGFGGADEQPRLDRRLLHPTVDAVDGGPVDPDRRRFGAVDGSEVRALHRGGVPHDPHPQRGRDRRGGRARWRPRRRYATPRAVSGSKARAAKAARTRLLGTGPASRPAKPVVARCAVALPLPPGLPAEGARKAKDAAVGQVNAGHTATSGPSASRGSSAAPGGAGTPGSPDDPPAPASVAARGPQPRDGGSAGAAKPVPPPGGRPASTATPPPPPKTGS